VDSETRVLYWLLEASRGGPSRAKIIRVVNKKPRNLRQISLAVKMDYKTVREHVEILVENGVLETPGKRYGAVYFLAAHLKQNDYLKKALKGGTKL